MKIALAISIITIITIRVRIRIVIEVIIKNKRPMSINCVGDNFVCMKKVRKRNRGIFFLWSTFFCCDFISTSVGFVLKNVGFLKQFCSTYFEYYDKKRKRIYIFFWINILVNIFIRFILNSNRRVLFQIN